MAKKRINKNSNTLKNRYRFVVLNDETFEEKFALTLTRNNAFVFISTIVVVLIALTSAAIIYTPLKYFIPGFGDYNYRSQILQLQFKADSIENRIQAREEWLANVNKVIRGEIDTTIPKAPQKTEAKVEKVKGPSKAEEELRKIVEEEETFSLSYNAASINEELEELKQIHFIAPVNGFVTDDFNSANAHFALDIATNKDEPVKAILDGTIVSANFTLDGGYTIAVQHKDNLISFYKHLGTILKKTGTFVRAGEVIGIVGNTGELTNGTHLHFEIWKNGKPINPRTIIPF
ncbi:MAG: M23 family metallopeptidase [Chitinophagales bacterium]|nr:M23 family metallopeptidase [Chitinophagales bacterium]